MCLSMKSNGSFFNKKKQNGRRKLKMSTTPRPQHRPDGPWRQKHGVLSKSKLSTKTREDEATGSRRELARAGARWRLDETRMFNHGSTKLCKGLNNQSSAPMGLA